MSVRAPTPIGERIRILDELLQVVEVDGVPCAARKPTANASGLARKYDVGEAAIRRWESGPAGKQWLAWRLAKDSGASDEQALLAATGDVRISGTDAPDAPAQAPAGDPFEGLDPVAILLEALSTAAHLDDALDAAMIERAEWDEWMRLASLPASSLELQDADEHRMEEVEWCRWLRKSARAAEARCKLTLLRSIITGGSSAAQLQLLGRRWREQFGITAASTGDAGEVNGRPDAELDAIIAAAGSGDGPG